MNVKEDQVSHKQRWDLHWEILKRMWSDPISRSSEQYEMAEMKDRKQYLYEHKN